MPLFILLSLVFVVVALVIVLPAFISRRRDIDDELLRAYRDNVAAARERKRVLRDAVDAGELTDEQAGEYLVEIESALLQDIENASPPPADGDRKTPAAVAGERDWWGAGLVAATLLLSVPLFYIVVGSPKALWLSGGGSSAQVESAHDMEEIVAGLQSRLAENPDDPDALYWLGRVHGSRGDYKTAIDYYERAHNVSESADLSAVYVYALMSDDAVAHRDKINALLESGLRLQPADPVLLQLAGIHADTAGRVEEALAFWRRAHDNLVDFPEQQLELAAMISDAEQRLRGGEAAGVSPPSSEGVVAIVDIGADVTVPARAVLFVFTRAAGTDAPPMPLAAYRHAGDVSFPLTVRLNDGMAMLPEMKMSNFAGYNVEARLSTSGGVEMTSGDIYGQVPDVPPRSTVQVIINRTVP